MSGEGQAPWGGLKIDLSAVRREKKLDGKWVITSASGEFRLECVRPRVCSLASLAIGSCRIPYGYPSCLCDRRSTTAYDPDISCVTDTRWQNP
jgi:hypothetical protein